MPRSCIDWSIVFYTVFERINKEKIFIQLTATSRD